MMINKIKSTIFAVVVFSIIAIVALFGYIQSTKQANAKNEVIEQERIHQAKVQEYAESHPLKALFDSGYFSGFITFDYIVNQEQVKERIIVQYSQKFYDMLPLHLGSTAYDYDENENCWSCEISKGSTMAKFHYFPNTDKIKITLYLDDLYIDRNGNYELGEHNLKYPIDSSSKEYKAHIEKLRADNNVQRIKKEEHKAYLLSLTLVSTFDSFDYHTTLMPQVIANKKIKDRIVKQYSQDFYNLLSIWNDTPNTRYEGFCNEGRYYTYCSAVNEFGSSVHLGYNSSDDTLTVTLKLNGVDVDSNGYYDIGYWKLDYFENEFGEKVKSEPFVILGLVPSEVNRQYYDNDDELMIRISRDDGIVVMYRRGKGAFSDYIKRSSGDDPVLTIRREYDGAIFKFNLSIPYRDSPLQYVDEDQYDLFLTLLDGGNLTISYKYYRAFEYETAVVKVQNQTKSVYSAINYLSII